MMDDNHWPARVRGHGQFQRLQALEDAIAYRQARLTTPCPDCESGAAGGRCDDHACDVMLVAAYQQTASATIQGMSGSFPASLPGSTDQAAPGGLLRDRT